MDNTIKASNLTKYYGKFLAVDHISFEVKSWGFLAFWVQLETRAE
jgi:ABC-type multidrug transport system ATPase subunit